jgi:aminoglycoside phosphotransferase (APT) family kinase protein
MPTDIRSNPDKAWIEAVRERYEVERTVDLALTRKLERRASQTFSIAKLDELTQRLEAFLAKRIDGPFAIRNLKTLTGGNSKEQFSFELDWTCNGEVRKGERVVLRREQAESIVEADKLREFQLVGAAAAIMPVPTAYWLDETGEELGRPALIYSFVTGVQKPTKSSSKVTGIGINFDAAHREALGPQFIDYLARMHNFDPAGHDLTAFDIPQVNTTQDIDWQINWWARAWFEDRLEEIPIMTVAEHWLRANHKPLDHLSLVHGDFRTGNFLFDEETLKITAILDWELGYFGDRHGDLAWVLNPAFITPSETGEPLHTSLFRRDEFLRDYEKASGLKVDEERLIYYNIFAYWRSVVLTLASGPRAAGALKTHQDVVLSWFAGIAYPLIEALRIELDKVIR